MAELKWGIVGLGRIAASFAEAIMGTPGQRIAAVCSRDIAKARLFGAACGPAALAFDELSAMLAQVDALYVASPNALHREHALTGIAARRAVLIEKPLAATAQEARDIADAARAAGVFCMEAMWTRFTPAVVRAKAMAEEGALGRLTSFTAELAYAQPERPGSRFHDLRLGGGALLDLGVYPLSLALHFLGEPTGWSAMGVKAGAGVERAASVALRFADAVASFTCGFDAEGANGATLIGDRARLTLHRPLVSPSLLTLAGQPAAAQAAEGAAPLPSRPSSGSGLGLKAAARALHPLKNRPIIRPARGNGLGHQAEEVARCMGAGLIESPVMPLAQSVRQMEILEDLIAMARA